MAVTYKGPMTLTSQSAAFEKKYAPRAVEVYEVNSPVMSILPMEYNHQGESFNKTLYLSLGGGRGAGTLPTPSQYLTKRVSVQRKKVYNRHFIEREALYASKGGGAVDELFARLAVAVPQSHANMTERALFAPYATSSNAVVGSGKLGTLTAVTGSNPYTVTLANDFKAANFEVGDIVNIETANTDDFEIQAIDTANKQLTVERVSGSQVPVATDEVFLQNSEDLDIIGLQSVVDFVSGDTLFGVANSYRFAPYRKNMSGALTLAAMEEAMLQIGTLTGEGPTDIIVPVDLWSTVSTLVGGANKRYIISKGQKKVEGLGGYSSLAVTTPYGDAAIHVSRFADADRVYFVNSKHWVMKHAQGFGFFKDTGSVFLARPDDDQLEIRFGGYKELFVDSPAYFGVIYGIT